VASQATGLSAIAGRYAAALYQLADEGKELDAVARDLGALGKMIDESADLRRLTRSPLIAREVQAKAMATILERAGVGATVRHFVGVAADNRRLFLLPQMIAAYLATLAALPLGPSRSTPSRRNSPRRWANPSISISRLTRRSWAASSSRSARAWSTAPSRANFNGSSLP
jgi:hypothetical protein